MELALSNISKGFDDSLVVNQVSLSVKSGELFVLLGSSGSGKSTLLRVISGLIVPSNGSITLAGKDITNTPPQDRNMGFVFQNYALFKHLNVGENIEFGLRIRNVSTADRVKRRDELLELVGLSGLGERMPQQLSGGQRQRVALARALAYQPSVLLLDEPFGALDVQIRSQLRRALREIQQQLKITTILVTHDQEEAFELGDRIGVLGRGRLIEVGTPAELYHQPKTEYVAGFIGGGNVLVGRAEKGSIRLGDAVLPFPVGAPKHEEGAPVRILFRPEQVVHQAAAYPENSGIHPIGNGRILETSFAGATRKLRFELSTLQGARPVAAALAYGQRFAIIEASESSALIPAPAIGDAHWVGLAKYHVLNPSGIKVLISVKDPVGPNPGLEIGARLTQASHGHATILLVASDREAVEKLRPKIQELTKKISAGNDSHFESRIREGNLGRETTQEVNQGYYDLLIMSVPEGDRPERLKKIAQLSRRLLLKGGIPVLFSKPNTAALSKILICTAGGESGKSDVLFGARLARHLKSKVTVFYVQSPNRTADEARRVERHLDRATATLSRYRIESEIRLGEGEPVWAIVDEATRGAYDLVILGAPGVIARPKHSSPDLVHQLVDKLPQSVAVVPLAEW